MADEAHEQEAAGDAQQPQEPAGEPVGGTGGTEATEGGTGAQEGALSPNREAAKRRRQLREVEAERDALRERLDSYDRAEVERLAADHLADPGDLWLSTSIADLRSDDGALDTEKVAAELARVTAERPHWRKQPPRPEVHQGAGRGALEPDHAASFGERLRRAGGG